MKALISGIIRIFKVFFTSSEYGSFVEGKLCPKCHTQDQTAQEVQRGVL